GRLDAGVQLLLPAAAVHTHAAGLAELVLAARVPGHGGGGGRARGAGAAARKRVCGGWSRGRVPARRRPGGRGGGPGTRRGRGGAAVGVERGRIVLGGDGGATGGEEYPLMAGGRRVGTIALTRSRRWSAAARRRLLPALASLLGVAIDRERLAREALEAETLRR